ncbi:MAG: secondary thiamine-phosphate synthase enzyme YjbQ [Candidatus Omnitrophica bacterium]|nr:secondary thiamine-phosphate synthase enzyme YjbQ [Candidatus Omnitrophota bacterium]MCB9720256.1 YjbQ family protein [Candidatus Omnitrophota bacterium]
MHRIKVKTHKRDEIIDLTRNLQAWLLEQDAGSGILVVYSPHTTAAISVNENYDPDVKSDMLRFLKGLVPQNAGFDHAEGNSDSHIKGGLFNFSQTFIVEDGRLMLGQWQGIYFMEFDGPRSREVWVKFIADG